LKNDFERILGRPVDVIDRETLDKSQNTIRKGRIPSEAKPVHAA